MTEAKTDIANFTDEDILKQFSENKVIGDMLRGDPKELLPGFKELCHERDWTVARAIEEIETYATASIIGTAINQCGRTIRSNSININ